MKASDIAQLAKLTQARLEAEKAKLARVTRDEQALRQQLAELVKDQALSVQRKPDADDPALRAGADVRWHRWVDSRRSVLNQELALKIARRLRQLEETRKAFGQSEATRLLENKVRLREKEARARRIADRDA